MSAIEAALQQEVERARTIIIRRMQRAGEEAINVARGSGKNGKDWTDRTGNLRSSLGYIIVDNGDIIMEGGFAGSEGASKGRTFATQLASNMADNQFALIVVAGMHYASYVADRGYDVLDSAELMAKKVLEQLNNG